MLKSISNLGKELNKSEKEQIKGGFGPLQEFECVNPYLNPGGECMDGYVPHPVQGHCICCQA